MWKWLRWLALVFVACQQVTPPPPSVADKRLPARRKPMVPKPRRFGLEVTPASATAELDGKRAVAADEERVVSVAAALASSCALLESGNVWCWGQTHSGTSGGEADALRQIPVARVTKLVGAGARFFALSSDGKLSVWGQQRLRVGDPFSSELPLAVPLGAVRDVAASWNNFCALEVGGRITCWTGNGNASIQAELPTAQSIAVSSAATCARLYNGQVSCFGVEAAPSLKAGLTDVVELVAGGPQHCARRRNGSVSCWPQASDKRFGNVQRLAATPHAVCAFQAAGLPVCAPFPSGANEDEFVYLPEQVFPRSANLSDVSIGTRHGCAVLRGRAWCWGDGGLNELGLAGKAWQEGRSERTRSRQNFDGDAKYVLARVVLGDTAALNHVADVALSEQHSCVVTLAGTVRCWGDNQWGQLGVATDPPAFGVVHATDLSNVQRVVASDGVTCALVGDGDLYCWGRQPWRTDLPICKEGSAEAAPCSEKPSLLASGVLQVGVSADFGCLLDRERQVRCWGNNQLGQLGTGDTLPSARPTPVLAESGMPLAAVRELRVFASHACAIDDTGKLWCWGDNAPLVQGRRYNSAPKLLRASVLPGLPTVRDVNERCILTQAGELRCWGDVSADTVSFSYEPVRVGHCGVTQLVLGGPGRCFVDQHGLNCLDLPASRDDGFVREAVRFEHPGLRSAGSGGQVCTIESRGALACFRYSSFESQPSVGTVPVQPSSADELTPGCPRDAAPRLLPSFPPVQPASVTVAPAAPMRVRHAPAEASRRLSPNQIARVLLLLNARDNYTHASTCHDALFEIIFRDARGEVQAEVSVGSCGTLASSPEIPAKHGHGNVVHERLSSGLLHICSETGLAACQGPAPRSFHH